MTWRNACVLAINIYDYHCDTIGVYYIIVSAFMNKMVTKGAPRNCKSIGNKYYIIEAGLAGNKIGTKVQWHCMIKTNAVIIELI